LQLRTALPAALAVCLGTAAGEPPDFLHIPTGTPLDLSPRPGEVLSPAVLDFHRTGRNRYRDDAEAIAAGRLIFRQRCSFCHAYDGSGGNAPPINGTGFTYATSAEDAGMFSIIWGGGFGAMRSFARHGLSQDEVLQLIAYVRRLAEPGPERDEARRDAAIGGGAPR